MRLVCYPVGDDLCTTSYTYDVVIVLYLLYQIGTTSHSLHKNTSDVGVISSDRVSIDNVSDFQTSVHDSTTSIRTLV